MSNSTRNRAVWMLLMVGACGPTLTAQSSDDNQPTAEGDGGVETMGAPLCGPDSPEALGACVDRDRYLDDLLRIADVRVPGDAHWQRVQDLCAERLGALGYEVERHRYGSGGVGVNVVGRKQGTGPSKEEVVIAAHYDHIEGCQGADDNASGVAGVLEAARVLAMGTYERTLVVACWDQEEVGLIGSSVFAKGAVDEGVDILVNFNFEMIGYKSDEPDSQSIPSGFDLLFPEAYRQVEANDFRGDFVAVVADDGAQVATHALAQHASRIGLPHVVLELERQLANSPIVGDLRRSDHAAFWTHGFPAMMLTDTSNFRYANYHCRDGEDSVDLLDHDFAAAIVQATVAASAEVLVLQ